MPLIYKVSEDTNCRGLCKVKHVSIKIMRQDFPFLTLILSQMYPGAFRRPTIPYAVITPRTIAVCARVSVCVNSFEFYHYRSAVLSNF